MRQSPVWQRNPSGVKGSRRQAASKRLFSTQRERRERRSDAGRAIGLRLHGDASAMSSSNKAFPSSQTDTRKACLSLDIHLLRVVT